VSTDFFDSGVYHYRLNGQATQVREHWQRHRQAMGEWLVTSGRSAPGVNIEVEARMTEGLVTQFEVLWQADDRPERRAHYTAQDNAVEVVRTEGTVTERELVSLRSSKAAPLLSPLMRIYAGPVIARLLVMGGQGEVVLPFIGDPADEERLLRPQVSQRQARVLENDVELSLGGAEFRCRVCEYSGDQYAPGTRFWLAEDDLLVRYQWQQAQDQQWDVWLQRSV
jgi:hypothetical protein